MLFGWNILLKVFKNSKIKNNRFFITSILHRFWTCSLLIFTSFVISRFLGVEWTGHLTIFSSLVYDFAMEAALVLIDLLNKCVLLSDIQHRTWSASGHAPIGQSQQSPPGELRGEVSTNNKNQQQKKHSYWFKFHWGSPCGGSSSWLCRDILDERFVEQKVIHWFLYV